MLNRARNRAQARNRTRRARNRAEKRRPRAEKGRKRPQARRAGKIGAQAGRIGAQAGRAGRIGAQAGRIGARAGGLVEGRSQSMCLQSTILSHLSAKLLRPPLHRGPPPLCVVPLNLLCAVFCSAPLLCRPPSGSSAVSPTLRLQPSGNLQFLSYPTPSFLQFINCDVVCACALLCCAYCLCSGLWCECVICIYFVLCFACALLVLLNQ